MALHEYILSRPTGMALHKDILSTVRPRLTFFLGPKKNRVNQNRVNRG